MKDNSPRWDNWHVRLPAPKDQRKAINLFQKSGAKTKSDFVCARLLGEPFKVIAVDGSTVVMLRKLEGFAANAFNVFFAGALNPFFEISRPKEKKRKKNGGYSGGADRKSERHVLNGD